VCTAASAQDRLEWSASPSDRLNLGEPVRPLTLVETGGATVGLYILRNERMPCPLRESKSGSLVVAKSKGVRHKNEQRLTDCMEQSS
jgi:hypothetical protein